MDAETREYLDGRWFWHATESEPPEIIICGNDGDPIVTCCWHNAAHFLTPVAVAEYLMALHDAHRLSSTPTAAGDISFAAYQEVKPGLSGNVDDRPGGVETARLNGGTSE